MDRQKYFENLTIEQQTIEKLNKTVKELRMNNKRLREQLFYARKKAGIKQPNPCKVDIINLYEQGSTPSQCAESLSCSKRFARLVISEYKKAAAG